MHYEARQAKFGKAVVTRVNDDGSQNRLAVVNNIQQAECLTKLFNDKKEET